MDIKVAADTVTDLTIAAAPSPTAGGPRPTAEELVGRIRAQLQGRIDALSKSARNAQANDPQKGHSKKQKTAFHISHGEAVRDLQNFERIISSVPNGFRLEPVLYTRIKYEQNADVYNEYVSYVRADFMRFLANNHADELKELGICEQGIAQMKQGLDPRSEAGVFYDINIDHIIERNGGGKLSQTRSVDPDKPAGSLPTYETNHFNNFVLLPLRVHDMKNDLNGLQEAATTPPGQSRWILMLVPETAPGHSGFVAQPQGATLDTNENFNLGVHNVSAYSYVTSLASRVHDTITIIAAHPEQKPVMQPLLDAAIEEAASKLQKAFEKASQPRKDIKAFCRFYRDEKVQRLRQDESRMTPAQAARIENIFQSIDNSLSARFPHGQPFQEKQPKKPKQQSFNQQQHSSRHGQHRDNRGHKRHHR